jgi:hypothetical protein
MDRLREQAVGVPPRPGDRSQGTTDHKEPLSLQLVISSAAVMLMLAYLIFGAILRGRF